MIPQEISGKYQESGGAKTIDLNQFPDHGLQYESSPEILRLRRDAVVSCVGALVLAPAGFAQFESAVIEMFHQFNVDESQEAPVQGENRRRWHNVYDSVQVLMEEIKRGAQPVIDIEMRGRDKSYANVRFESFIDAKGELAVLVFPGDCSSSGPRKSQNPYFPEKNFYDVFNKTIGSDPDGKIRSADDLFIVTENGFRLQSRSSDLSK